METGGLTLGWHDGFKEALARLFVAKPVMASLDKGFCLNWSCVVCRQTTSLTYMHFLLLRVFIMTFSSSRMAGGSQIAQKGKRGNFSTGTSDRKIQVGDISEKNYENRSANIY